LTKTDLTDWHWYIFVNGSSGTVARFSGDDTRKWMLLGEKRNALHSA
jgi:hypothetical protein